MRDGYNFQPLNLLYSVDNGIIFVSNHNKENYVFSTVDSKYRVKTVVTTRKEYEEKYRSKNNTKIDNFCAKLERITNIALFFTIIILLFFAPREELILTIILTVGRLECLFLIFAFIMTFVMQIFVSDKSAFKFHGAEHMVANAYNDLERIPTRKELKKYSRFNKDCGGNFALLLFLNCISLFLCSYLSLEYGIIVFGLVLVLTFFGYRKGVFNFIQKFTTMPPTQKELDVALNGLKLWLEMENQNEF